MNLAIPAPVQAVLQSLRAAGYQACPVGGCVRDTLLGHKPHDWDVTTAATPEQAEAALAAFRCLETGKKHGTITALSAGMPIEVTTFRIDGAYSDNRRPDSVRFTRSLAEDLQRRDFTINAMAWDQGLVDPFHGQCDLSAGVIRCVGAPERRFQEDGLRVLRALRFASVLDFTVEPLTAHAVHQQRGLLRHIAVERVQAELGKLLCGPGAGRVLREFADVCFVCLPELAPLYACPQAGPYHCYDAWGHTAAAVDAAPPDAVLRLTMLLHDAGKPACRTRGADGLDHFYGHEHLSAQLAATALRRLRFPAQTCRLVQQAVALHMLPLPPQARLLKRRLRQNGPDLCRLLLQVKRADTLAQAPAVYGRLQALQQAQALLSDLLARQPCFTRAQLAVKGGDLVSLGLRGPAIGRALEALLDAVVEGRCANEKEALLHYWRQRSTSSPCPGVQTDHPSQKERPTHVDE